MMLALVQQLVQVVVVNRTIPSSSLKNKENNNKRTRWNQQRFVLLYCHLLASLFYKNCFCSWSLSFCHHRHASTVHAFPVALLPTYTKIRSAAFKSLTWSNVCHHYQANIVLKNRKIKCVIFTTNKIVRFGTKLLPLQSQETDETWATAEHNSSFYEEVEPRDHSIFCKDQINVQVLPLLPSMKKSKNVAAFQIDATNLNENFTVVILSCNPLIYLVQNLLSEAECERYINYVSETTKENNNVNETKSTMEKQKRIMTRSNAPTASLDISKLWPLPFLSILSGLPPYLKLVQQEQLLNDASKHVTLSERILGTLQTIGPTIGITFLLMIMLSYCVVLPIVAAISSQSARTSVAVALNNDEDVEFVRPLVERVSFFASLSVLLLQQEALTSSSKTGRSISAGMKGNKDDKYYNCEYPITNWEAPVVTRYDPGALFSRHNDASLDGGIEWMDNGGQRVVTCICYLNTLNDGNGGETYFDQLKIAVTPKTGTALFFFPSNRTTWIIDDRTTHESIATRGTSVKWIVQLFGRALPVPVPLGLPLSFFEFYKNQ